MADKTLIAVLSTGKGTWGHVGRLIADGEWAKIILISNDWAKENFTCEKEVEWICVNNRAPLDDIIEEINENLTAKDNVCINIISGSGKEHMALLAALNRKTIDYELTVLSGDGISFM